MLMFLMCSLIGGLSALNSSSRKGPMLATVDDNSSALQSCTVMSMKPIDSARAECRAADGPISVRMQRTGELLLLCFSTGLDGATNSKNQGETLRYIITGQQCLFLQESTVATHKKLHNFTSRFNNSSCWSDFPHLKGVPNSLFILKKFIYTFLTFWTLP